MSHFFRNALLACLLQVASTGAGSAYVDVSSHLDLAVRIFPEDPRWPGQDDATLQYALSGAVDVKWRGDTSSTSFIPYLRYDGTDDNRSLVDLREAYWAWEAGAQALLVGVDTVFWGVAESVHLVDIINQTDAVADIDGESKLGQPMVNPSWHTDWGQLDFYLLPYFRERRFPGREGRLRTPFPVDADAARYESPDQHDHVDFSLRYSHFIGSIDIGLMAFKGTNREPRLVPNADETGLVAYYDQIEQYGLDLQVTIDAWLWKLEAITRDTRNDSFAAAVGGFEYTFYQVGGSVTDVGALFELQYDGRDEGEAATLADNDVFVGFRLARNDAQDTSLLAAVGYDVETSETYFNVEGERRIGDSQGVELRARMFTSTDIGDVSYAIEKDDYLELRWNWYF